METDNCLFLLLMWPFLSGSNEILCGHVEGKNEMSVIKELQLFLENIKEKGG